eukprot:TRINITY_DN23792_c0_g1_i1.p1 TRINITY_DN23792_c0_g1~~TRINITY_DN23792_c0_g1_i1.p1  ORF type:complete len:412 (+),score=62.68 TRINITY_DN23792_c0_g1_i1:94-1329(+)
MAAASRLLLFRASFFPIYRNSPAPLSLSLKPPLNNTLFFYLRSLPATPKPAPLPSLQFYTSSSAAALDAPPESSEALSHPWPEWLSFIDRLKTKGYFDEPTIATTENEESGGGDKGSEADVSLKDMHRLKNGCLNFARERFDILRSLSRKDIQTVVECGCPSLFRKAVNSAKRLRAFVRLDEGDVCSACKLRASCDRAYVIAKDDEGARTVDIVRILLSYAMDPLVLSEGEKPPGREHIEASARKLLSELIGLSETPPDPALPKPAMKLPSQKEQSQKVMDHDKWPQNVELKRGDWICSKCNFMNFSRNVRCLECKEDGPKRVDFDAVEMKKGDWTCPQCQFMNFARNKTCFRCQELRPKREMNPGEWECPSCDFLNFRGNIVCRKCNHKPPKDEAMQYEDQMWRKPGRGC